MAKDRKYKGVMIHYDEKGFVPSFFGPGRIRHWYINKTCSLKNGSEKTIRLFFRTLANTKKYISEH